MNRDKEDRKWGMITHLAAFLAILLPIGIALGPLIVWLMKKDDSKFLYTQGTNAINFQLTILIVTFVIMILSVKIRSLMIVALLIGVVGLVFAAIAAIQAKKHITFHYPFSLKLIK